MRKIIKIDIPKPCSENWDAMTPTEKGRHCALCKKTVFDFTSKTDEQIFKTIAQNTNLCGRFKTTQLQRDIVFSRKETNNYLSLVASGLFAFIGLGSQYMHSQGKPNIVQTSTPKPIIIGKVAPPVVKSDSVVGFIIDESKQPLPGANVLIKGTTVGTVTDFDGKFSINAKNGDVLIVSYLGFETRELKITDNTKYDIMLEMTEDVSGELVVVGGAISNSSYVCSPEELERKRQNKFRTSNYFTFYKKQQKDRKRKIKNGELPRSSFGKFLYNITSIFR
ncbi:carboxypeptidase-like regulatory domain-containing protein [Mariniflexile jejuense]|uniref:Carboxypeptidase-like regulatory domain-containing protein n=1 Tax=Mariniflexile jejuense TaxID=1173582 RepID=A0ABW3JFG5_9FLAO